MKQDKSRLIKISQKIDTHQSLTPEEITYFILFEKTEKDSTTIAILKQAALPASLALGFFFAAFPETFDNFVSHLPNWTNLPPQMLAGVDYLWNLLSDPVEKANIVYHIPNLVLYSFGILGIKRLVDALEHRNWLDKVLAAQQTLREAITSGELHLRMKDGHSLLFIGKGDFIGMQFVVNHQADETVTISHNQPRYTQFWNRYDADTLYEDLKNVLLRSSGHNAGEYIFFPVKDDQIFLPGDKAYDLSPHKLDILCQNIRVIEKEKYWKPKRIIIIGDKFHRSYVQSEDMQAVIPQSEESISLESIAKKYPNITLLDPSDIVLQKIIEIAKGRKIVFRATKEGISEYKPRFYERLKLLGYSEINNTEGILTIGYDLFEDQTEQQTLSRKIDDYFPVVLSKNVRDALIRNGYKKEEFLYVPSLVLETLTHIASEQ